jgi:hypothetical protein
MRFAILFLVACGVEPVVHSGTRLVLMHSDSGDWILDTELPGECTFQRESEDSFRCVPDEVMPSDAFVRATREGASLVAEDGLVIQSACSDEQLPAGPVPVDVTHILPSL